jgi:monovalent cation:H+ antiporter, CPA1 family
LEKTELKEIFRRGEINEAGFKKILDMLEIQISRVEQEKRQLTSINEHFSDWFYIPFINLIRKALFLKPKVPDPEEVYLYYRTQYKLISKVIDVLSTLENSRLYEVFDDKEALDNVLKLFKKLQIRTEDRMKTEIKSSQKLLDKFNRQSVKNLLEESQNLTLAELHDREIITTKLYISLKKELKTH